MGRRGDLTSNRILREGRSKYFRRTLARSERPAVKWLKRTVATERRALEAARRRFVSKPTESRLHAVRTAGRRFRSLLEDVAELAPSAKLLRRVKRAAEQQLKGILGYTEAPNVSSDFNHDPHSAVFHMDQTKVIDGTLVRVLAWYDNEWGFSNRMVDTAVAMGKLS